MLIFIIQALLDFQIKSTFQMPSRGRKRFVSEGDGGLVKETSWSVLSSCWLSFNWNSHFYSYFRWWESWGRKGVDSLSATFISRAKPMFTSDPRRSEGAVFKSGIAFTSCLHLKMALFPTSRVTRIIVLPLNLWTFPIILWKISQKLFFLISCPSIIAKLKQIVIRPNLILNSIAYTQNCVYTGDCSQNLESIPKLNWIHNYPWMELWEKVVSWNHQNKCCILRSSEK